MVSSFILDISVMLTPQNGNIELDIIHSEDDRVNSNSKIFFSKPDCRNVTYKDIPPFVNPFNKNKLNVRDYEYIKSEVWAYESEIRIVSPKWGLHFYNINSLKEIIFGINISENLKFAVENIVKHKSEFSSVKLLKCERETDRLKMKLKEY